VLAPPSLTRCLVYLGEKHTQSVVLTPSTELGPDTGPRTEIVGEVPPLSSCVSNVQQCVYNLPCALAVPPPSLGWLCQHLLDYSPLVICQIRLVCHVLIVAPSVVHDPRIGTYVLRRLPGYVFRLRPRPDSGRQPAQRSLCRGQTQDNPRMSGHVDEADVLRRILRCRIDM